MVTELKDIPKDQAIILLGQALIEEGEELIKDLDNRLTRLKTIKKELLKLKWHINTNQNSEHAHMRILIVNVSIRNQGDLNAHLETQKSVRCILSG